MLSRLMQIHVGLQRRETLKFSGKYSRRFSDSAVIMLDIVLDDLLDVVSSETEPEQR